MTGLASAPHKRPRRLDPALWVVIAVTLIALIAFDRPLAVGDGLAYLIWLDSIALDGDLDLSNQAEKFAAVNTYHIYQNPQTGRWASAFSLGIALLLTPFYWIGALLDTLPAFRINDAHFLGIQGVPFAYTFCSMVGVNLYALATVIMGYRLARRHSCAGPWGAAGVTLAVYLGTPLLFYTTVDPMNSHIAGAFAATLFLTLWLNARALVRTSGWRAATRRQGKTRFGNRGYEVRAFVWRSALRWLWIGLAAGLTALCRWQVALIAFPVGVELLLRRRWREVVALGLGFALLAWIIPYSWWQMYGKLALIPATQGDESAVLIAPVNTLRVLFSPISGLFPWSPIAALALIGLWPLARRDWPLALSAVVMFTSQALVNGSVKNWWAGIGFGMRRMAELYPVYVLCLAALFGAASRRRWSAALVWALTAACVIYGLALVLARFNFTWTNPWGLARDTPLKELTYSFSREQRYLIWPVIKDHVGPWAWRKPGP
jgi:hypothetical protein